MKKGAFLAVLVAFLFAAGSLFSDNGSPVGRWRTIDDETKKAKSIVELYEVNGVMYGKIVELIGEPNGGKDKICEALGSSRKTADLPGANPAASVQASWVAADESTRRRRRCVPTSASTRNDAPSGAICRMRCAFRSSALGAVPVGSTSERACPVTCFSQQASKPPAKEKPQLQSA